MGENGRSNLARQSDFHVITGFFNMQQSCDMGLPQHLIRALGDLTMSNVTYTVRYLIASVQPSWSV
jgi:hypothetical protein